MVLIAKAIAVWLAILVFAIANGFLREAVLVPRIGRAAGHVLSGVLLSAVILSVALVALPWLDTRQRSSLFAIGFGWLVLTIAFEFSFGRLQGLSWSSILEAYTFKDGNIWPLVLLVTAFAPYLAAQFRGWP